MKKYNKIAYVLPFFFIASLVYASPFDSKSLRLDSEISVSGVSDNTSTSNLTIATSKDTGVLPFENTTHLSGYIGKTGTVRAAYLNYRTSPWGEILATLQDGDKVEITGYCGDWFIIRHNNKTVYVHSKWVNVDDYARDYSDEGTILKNAEVYNENGDVISSLDEDDTVEILANAGFYWKIKFDGNEAYVFKTDIEAVENDEDLEGDADDDNDDDEVKQIEATRKADSSGKSNSSNKSNSKKSTESDDVAVTTSGKTRALIVAETAVAMAKQMKKDGNWHYHDKNKRKKNKYYECSSTFAKARRGSRRSCCCHFANWAMQAAGMIEGGKVVSHTAAGKGHGKKAISHPERVKHCKFIYPDKTIKEYKSKLKSGDILIHDSSICVYVVENGKPVCYTGRDGRSMVCKNLKYKRNRVTSGYEFNHDIYVIIRPVD